jgi:phage tail tape-measure protein
MSKQQEKTGVPKRAKGRAEEAAAIAGEIAGGIVGSAAGPAGTVAGMVIGAIAGTVVGAGLEAGEEDAERHQRELDETIGVQGGNLGAARPDAPPARIGAFSLASSGAASKRPSPAEGPIQDVDEDS